MEITLKEVAKITGAELVGDESFTIRHLCDLTAPQADGICYLVSIEKVAVPPHFTTGAIILPESAKGLPLPIKTNFLFAKNPEWAFNLLVQYYDAQKPKHTAGIHPTAVISPSAKLGANVSVGAYSVIEDDVVIGDNTVIFPQVYVGKRTQIGQNCILYPQVVVREECVLKNHVILQPGAKIGNDGFGFMFHEGRHHKVPQIGNVIIEDDVEIQANSCVDRAKLAHTVIGANTKIDNLVQIAHNVKVGQGCIMCAQVGVAGTTTIGNGVVAAGQVGIVGHLKIGSGIQIGAKSGVMDNLADGQAYFGTPARPMRETLKILAIEGKLPEIYKDLKLIKKAVEK
ncbi:MAG: UDP-3-O-(3-hydroxymyristoyl)glucosamine N-acyltransferase [Elusimicrobiaceae bacterium]|nr:UDP-3-O-(3-hydroxymyristoyl)glucosamine N-acyltransferase [Elusimicrobiaceae bacterium]